MVLDPNATPLDALAGAVPGATPGATPSPQGEVIPPDLEPLTQEDFQADTPKPDVGTGGGDISFEEHPQVAGLKDFLKLLVPAEKKAATIPEITPLVARPGRKVKIPIVTEDVAKSFLEGTLPVGSQEIKLNYGLLDNTGQIDELINSVAKVFKSEFEEVKRGVIPDAKLREMSKTLGLGADDILGITTGGVMNAEQLLAANEILGTTAKQILEFRDTIRKFGLENDPTVQDAVRKQIGLLLAVESKVRGSTSEIGRALRATQIPLEGGVEAGRIADIVKIMGPELETGVRFHRFLQMLDAVESPQQMNIWTRLWQAKGSAFIEAWINALLSNPVTHAANITGNIYAMALGVAERQAAGLRGLFRTGPEKVYMGEAFQMLAGGIEGFVDASRLAWTAFRTGSSQSAGGKLDSYRQVISSQNLGTTGVLGVATDALGTAARLPTRFLLSEDEFFKAINFRMALRAEAYRAAKIQGLEGDALVEGMAKVMNEPPLFAKVYESAGEYARYQTFTNELGALGKSAQAWSNAHPMAKMIAPFVSTPTNLAVYTLERLPGVNFLMKNFRADLFGTNGPVAADMAFAKLSLGAAFSATLAAATYGGMITGRGPLNPQVRDNLKQTGWQPYSIYNPAAKTYYSFNRADPLGMFMGAAADMAQITNDMPQADAYSLGAAMAATFGNALMSKTYLQGVSGLLTVMSEGSKGQFKGDFQKFVQQFASSVVPAGVGQVARILDPQVKEIETALGAIYAKLPGWSESVQPKRDLYGRVILSEGAWGPDIVSPIKISTQQDEPGLKEIVRNRLNVKTAVPATLYGPHEQDVLLDPTYQVPGVDLTADQHDRYGELMSEVRLGGRTLKEALDHLVRPENRSYWMQTDGPKGGKSLELLSFLFAYRQAAQNKLEKEYPELRTQMADILKQRGELLQPGKAPVLKRTLDTQTLFGE